MKKKNHKQRKQRKSERRLDRSVNTKRSKSSGNKTAESAARPWLRIVASGADEELQDNYPRGSLSHRNGRRQPRDLDLYIPEDNS
jgi:hypothetical protein